MSILNLIVGSHAAYLMTDSGRYALDGTLLELCPKTFIAGRQCVIGSTGAGIVTSILQGMQDRFDAPDFTLRELRDTVFTHYQSLELDPAEHHARVAAAVYSHVNGPQGFRFSTSPADCAPGEEPWMWSEVGTLLSPYYDPAPLWGDAGGFDPDLHAMALIESQRAPRNDWWAKFDGPRCCVAGTITLTEVSAAGPRSVALHEYPDRVGELAGTDSSWQAQGSE